MTTGLRSLSVIAGFLTVVFVVVPVMIFRHGTSPIRDAIAAAVFLAVALLALRCTWWLWRERPFWTDTRSLSEVAALGCFMLLLPLGAVIEPRIDGFGKDVLHIAMIAIVVSVYVFFRRHGRTDGGSG